jgi:uncharacterized protein YifE (UPF0438 family)
MTQVQPPKLIAPYVRTLQDLERGIRAPRTPLQLHFVAVCKGKARPMTEYERAYLLWRSLEREQLKRDTEERRQTESRKGRGSRSADMALQAPAGRWSDPKPYARFVAEPLGTREDFKRDRAANFAEALRNKL